MGGANFSHFNGVQNKKGKAGRSVLNGGSFSWRGREYRLLRGWEMPGLGRASQKKKKDGKR